MGKSIRQLDDGDPLLTTREVAGLFSVDDKTVRRWAAGKRLPSIKTPGGDWRFRTSAVRTFLTGRADGET